MTAHRNPTGPYWSHKATDMDDLRYDQTKNEPETHQWNLCHHRLCDERFRWRPCQPCPLTGRHSRSLVVNSVRRRRSCGAGGSRIPRSPGSAWRAAYPPPLQDRQGRQFPSSFRTQLEKWRRALLARVARFCHGQLAEPGVILAEGRFRPLIGFLSLFGLAL